MKISVVMVFHNELEFLPGWVKSVKRYADEIVCACHDATDGSMEYMEKVSKNIIIPMKIIYFPDKDTVYKHGFSYMKNAVADLATGDWVVSLDADEEMEMTKKDLRPFDRGADICVFSASMVTWSRNDRWLRNGEIDRKLMRKEAKWKYLGDTCSCRIFRNRMGIKWSGLIHERMRQKNGRLALPSRRTNIRRWDYGSMGDPKKREFKDGLYAELICRIVQEPSLLGATHNFWRTEYYEQNKEQLLKLRREYRDQLKMEKTAVFKRRTK